MGTYIDCTTDDIVGMSSNGPSAMGTSKTELPSPPSHVPVYILDGGLGTELEASHGVVFSREKTPCWSASLLATDRGKQTLLQCHRAFAAASTDILSTATYQLNPKGIAANPSVKDTDPDEDIIKWLSALAFTDSVEIVERAMQQAGNTTASIALSVGPYGACTVPSSEYTGDYQPTHMVATTSLIQWHTERLLPFAEAVKANPCNIRYIAFETLPRVSEVFAIRCIMSSDSTLSHCRAPKGKSITDVHYWISCVIPADTGPLLLPDNSTLTEFAEMALSSDYSNQSPYGIGVNCCKPHRLGEIVSELSAAVRQMAENTKILDWCALVLYPDGTNGEVYDPVTQTWVPKSGTGRKSQESWAQLVANVAIDAVNSRLWTEVIVGGCCRVTPGDIAELSVLLKDHRVKMEYLQ